MQAHYGGFWIRFFAFLIDCFVLTVISWLLALTFGVSLFATALSGNPLLLLTTAPLIVLAAAASGWLYYALMESSAAQATLGKRALGLRVTTVEGGQLSFGRATARYFSKILSSVLAIGYIIAAFMPRKQGLHDLIASTVVVRSF